MKILTSKNQDEILIKLWELEKALIKLPCDEHNKVSDIFSAITYEICGIKGVDFMLNRLKKLEDEHLEELADDIIKARKEAKECTK